MRMCARAAVAALALAVPVAVLVHAGPTASASTGLTYHFTAPPIASAGSIGPGQSVTFTVRVYNNGVLDPGGPVYLGYFQGGHVPGDTTSLPSGQCNMAQLPAPGSFAICTADTNGKVTLTYLAPTPLPAQGRADWVAQASTSSSQHAVTHYVYCSVFRFNPSPIAPSGTLAAAQPVPVTLRVQDGLDGVIPKATVYLSFTGSGSAVVNQITTLTSTPRLFAADSSGALQLTYTTPSSLPSSGQGSIVAQDFATSPTETNSVSYAFAANTPVFSVGDVSVVEGDQLPGIPAQFTVTVSPVQSSPLTISYVTLCGIGDKGCGEDFTQVTQPTAVTIPANSSSATFVVRQFAYVGGNAGETYNEGWFVELVNAPSGTQVGRSVGLGLLLPDLEGVTRPLGDLYVGGAGLVPTPVAGNDVWFTVTLGAVESSDVHFQYATADVTAHAGVDYAAVSGAATIPAGQTNALINVTMLPQAPPPSSRTFTLTISNASGPATIAPGNAAGTGTVLAAN